MICCQWPQSILSIAKQMAEKYGDDINKATEEAEKQIRKLPEFTELVNRFITHSVRDLIYVERHKENTRIKNGQGAFHSKPQVNGVCDSVHRALASVYYNYRIGGITLGSTLGGDLLGIAEKEASIAQGHTNNATLCTLLAKIVPEDKTVREAVPEKKLKQLFLKAHIKVGPDRDKAA